MTMLRGTLRELVVTVLWLAWLTTAHAETKNPITAITGLLTPSGQGCSGSGVLQACCPAKNALLEWWR